MACTRVGAYCIRPPRHPAGMNDCLRGRGGPCGGSEVWPGTCRGVSHTPPLRPGGQEKGRAHTVKRPCKPCVIISYTMKRLCRCCVIAPHTATTLCRWCMVISHTATTLRRWCMILSHTATTLCRCCIVISHTATTLCRCCVAVSHTATRLRRWCMVISHTATGHAMGRMQYAPTRVHVGRMLLRPYMYPDKLDRRP